MLAALVMFGVEQAMGWRIALIVPGVLMLIVGVMYWKFTQIAYKAILKELRAQGIQVDSDKKGGIAILMQFARNYRVWILFGA